MEELALPRLLEALSIRVPYLCAAISGRPRCTAEVERLADHMSDRIENPKVPRRLAAVLAADIAGYSALMGANEETTVQDLKAHQAVILPMIVNYGGRVIDTAGDGILAEFASVLSAVKCAMGIQKTMGERNAQVDPARRMQFRIGVNQGDVVFDDARIYGDGVNVAARLESIAEPGGVCISGKVHAEILGKIEATIHDLGPQQLKNIAAPVQVFRIEHLQTAAVGSYPRSHLALADKRSIAVLPFTNMSGDEEQDFFADGLTEDIITALSQFRELLVISRNSTFVYKGKAVNVQEVAKAFDVHYVLEGSVRRSGDRVRITAQLIDAETDRHVWAERYDRELKSIFEIQDDVTSSIAATLPGRVEAAAYQRITRKPTENMAAYELVLTAKVLHHRSRREDNLEAQRTIDRALVLDPNYAHAHAWRACIVGQSWVHNWCADRDIAWKTVNDELKIALALDDDDSDVHRVLAAVHLARGNHQAAEYHQQRALSLNPNNDLIVVQQGELYTWLGNPVNGIEWIRKAMRLNPHHPERFWNHLGRAYFVARRYTEAIESFRRISHADQFHHAFLAASSAMLGDEIEAAAQVRIILEIDPGFSREAYLRTLHYRLDSDREHHRQALLKAALPD
jgi:adenylate cyclase